jgi:hypothetical protein
MNRAKIRMQTVSSVWGAHGKRRRTNKFAGRLRKKLSALLMSFSAVR